MDRENNNSIRTFSEYTDDEREEALLALGDMNAISSPRKSHEKYDVVFNRRNKPYDFSSHMFGFVEPCSSEDGYASIKNLGEISSDSKLKNQSLYINLHTFRVAEYPGKNKRTVLLKFTADNYIESGKEDVAFSSRHEINNYDQISDHNKNIFRGINTGSVGLSFCCETILVEKKEDYLLLDLLDGEVFNSGLELLGVVQPSLSLLTQIIKKISSTILDFSRNDKKNHNIQKIELNLGFDSSGYSGRLREGTYVAMQVSVESEDYNWSNWLWAKEGRIMRKNKPGEVAPYNYIVFTIGKLE